MKFFYKKMILSYGIKVIISYFGWFMMYNVFCICNIIVYDIMKLRYGFGIF